MRRGSKRSRVRRRVEHDAAQRQPHYEKEGSRGRPPARDRVGRERLRRFSRDKFRFGRLYFCDLIAGVVEQHAEEPAARDVLRLDFSDLAVGELHEVAILIEPVATGADQLRGGDARRLGVDDEFGAVAEDEFFDEQDAVLRHGRPSLICSRAASKR